MPESVIISDIEPSDIKPVTQYCFHKIISRQGSHLPVKVKYHRMINCRLGEQDEFFIQCTQQLRLIITLKHLARMLVKSYHHRIQSFPVSIIHHLSDQKLMATVYSVKEADGCHARPHFRDFMTIPIIYLIHDDTYNLFTHFYPFPQRRDPIMILRMVKGLQSKSGSTLQIHFRVIDKDRL